LARLNWPLRIGGLRMRSKQRSIGAWLQQRAGVILLAAQGQQNKDIAEEVGLDRRPNRRTPHPRS
jgi:DNA-binding NarL/FixJ family response regulator